MDVRNYEKNRAIENGIKIKGTNKVFKNIINEDHCWSETSFNSDFNEFIDIVKDVEENLSIDIVQNIDKMEIEFIDDDIVIFGCVIGYETKYFFLNKENDNGISMPFKNFSSYLTVPVSFSKRNPGDLNKINFKYYQDKDEDVLAPIKIIYSRETKEFNYKDKYDDDKNILAHEIRTLIKGKTKDFNDNVCIENEIPLLHKILNNIKKEICNIDPEIRIKLHSYILGYDGFNKGRHFIRLVFDYGIKSISVGDEMYQLGLDIETDFSGISKDAKTVYIMPTLFRIVGETAFTVPFTKEKFLKVMNGYVEDKLNKESIVSGDKKYEEEFKHYVEEFTNRFDESCIYLRISEANSSLENSGFDRFISNWFYMDDDIYHQKYRLERNRKDLQNFERTENEFISNILLASKKLDFKAKGAIKYLILEYVAGAISKDQTFESYLDIIHFVNMIGLTYTTDIQREINQKIFSIVEILEGTKEYSIFNKYKSKLQRDFRENV